MNACIECIFIILSIYLFCILPATMVCDKQMSYKALQLKQRQRQILYQVSTWLEERFCILSALRYIRTYFMIWCRSGNHII